MGGSTLRPFQDSQHWFLLLEVMENVFWLPPQNGNIEAFLGSTFCAKLISIFICCCIL